MNPIQHKHSSKLARQEPSAQFSFLLKSMERQRNEKQLRKSYQFKQSLRDNKENLNNNSLKNNSKLINQSHFMNRTHNLRKTQDISSNYLYSTLNRCDFKHFNKDNQNDAMAHKQSHEISGVKMAESQQLQPLTKSIEAQSHLSKPKAQPIMKLINTVKKHISLNQYLKTTKLDRQAALKLENKSNHLVTQIINVISEIEEQDSEQPKKTQMRLGANKELSSSFHFPENNLSSFSQTPQNNGTKNILKRLENLEVEKQQLEALISQHQATNIKMYIRLNQGQSEEIEQYKRLLKDLFQKYKKIEKLLLKNQNQQREGLKERIKLQKQIERLKGCQNRESEPGSSIIAINSANNKVKKYEQQIANLNILINQQNQSLETALSQIQKLRQSQRASSLQIRELMDSLNSERQNKMKKGIKTEKNQEYQEYQYSGEKYQMICSKCNQQKASQSLISIPACHRKSNSYSSNLTGHQKKESIHSFACSDLWGSDTSENVNNIENMYRKTLPKKTDYKMENTTSYPKNGQIEDMYRMLAVQAGLLEKMM